MPPRFKRECYMTDDELRADVRQYLSTNPSGLIETIPSGSGIIHLANVDSNAWGSGFVSREPGRWTNEGQPSKYFADALTVCVAELGYTDDNPPCGKVVELWETTREFPAININKLPSPLRDALYQVKGTPPDKWTKPHILIEEVSQHPDYRDVKAIYAPSASGFAKDIGGMCFVADPNTAPIHRIKSQSYDDWQNNPCL